MRRRGGASTDPQSGTVPKWSQPVSGLESGRLAGAGHDLLLQGLEPDLWIRLSAGIDLDQDCMHRMPPFAGVLDRQQTTWRVTLSSRELPRWARCPAPAQPLALLARL